MVGMKTIIFHFTEEDRNYIPVLKPLLLGRAQVYMDNTVPVIGGEMCMKAKSKGGAIVVSTSQVLLRLIVLEDPTAKISEYAGSFFEFKGTWFLFINPLEQLVTTPTGKFILQRYLSKVLTPDTWLPIPNFKWELFQPSRMEVLYNFFETSLLIAIDIETLRNDEQRRIACISFTGGQVMNGKLVLMTVVVPMDSMYNVLFTRLVCSNAAPKTLQNGKYDIAYLLRYGCPITNYILDTINLFHSWYSELPKDLGFISGFMLREYQYHKNEGKSGDLMDFYSYNGMDTFTTFLATLSLLIELPQYAFDNFLMEFPVVFPCILSEHTGCKWDEERAAVLKTRVDEEMEEVKKKLRVMVDNPLYNPNSPPQTVRLFAILGSKDITTTVPAAKDTVANRHPLNKRIIDGIVEYREGSKLRGSYFKSSIPWLGRCFYALNPHGTDTGRLASRESQFWCGLQIQNIPADSDEEDVRVKECFVADEGFYFGEADFSQAESKGTAFLSGDESLLAATTDPTRDFHGINASAFFGVPYEKIVKSSFDEELGEWVHKTLDKLLRNTLGKRINHGANYNMGPQIMLDTMGILNVIRAKQTLNLPHHWSPLKVTAYLLQIFANTYPIMKGPWYDKCVNDVMQTGYLISPQGWTRKCFGNPKKNKHHLNAYVAHPSQNLNALILNKAYVKVFRNVWLPNKNDFKLLAQIHDSIFFQYRIGRQDIPWLVHDNMILPTLVKDTFGKVRTMTVPVDIKGGARRWSDCETLRRPKELLAS